MFDKSRGKTLIVIILIIGLCALAAGASGKLIMEKISDNIMSSFSEISNDSSSDLSNILTRALGNKAVDLVVSLIKNDPSEFVKVLGGIAQSTGSFLDMSGLGNMLISPFIEEAARAAFQTVRGQMVESAGAYMPFLQFAAYYHELLIAGGVMAGISLLLLFLIGDKAKAASGAKAFFVVGILLIIAIAVITMGVLNKLSDTMPEVTTAGEVPSSAQSNYVDTVNQIIQKPLETSIPVQGSSFTREQAIYNEANNLLGQGLVLAARQKFMSIYYYGDSYDRIRSIQRNYDDKFSAACWQTVAIDRGKTIVLTALDSQSNLIWNDVVSIYAGFDTVSGLKSNGKFIEGTIINNSFGSVIEEAAEDAEWNNVIALAPGRVHTTCLLSDGSAIAFGENDVGQCNVNNWHNLVALSSNGYDCTVGLCSNGTVRSTIPQFAEQLGENIGYDTSEWNDIVEIEQGGVMTVGLRSDGTVIFSCHKLFDQSTIDTSSWTDIVDIAAGIDFILGLKSDGTVVATGNNSRGQCDVGGWKDIVAIAAGYEHSVGLKKDGTLVAVGNNDHGQCNVNSWKLWD